jgi:hypothetical protein
VRQEQGAESQKQGEEGKEVTKGEKVAVLKWCMLLLLITCAWIVFSASVLASGFVAAPGWEVVATTTPTTPQPGGAGTLQIYVYNAGAAASSGGGVVTDTVPAGLVANTAGFNGHCGGAVIVTCELPRPIAPGGWELINIPVSAEPNASGTVVNRVTVAGGGSRVPASTSDKITVSSTSAGFGFAGFDGWFTNADGTPDTQAGSHPYEATFAFDLNRVVRAVSPESQESSVFPAGGEVRDLEVNLPRGLIGNPSAVSRCTRQQLDAGENGAPGCPVATQVGTATVGLGNTKALPFEIQVPIYNMVPPPGIPAQFGFELEGIPSFIDGGVRSGSDYGITGHTNNIPQRFVIFGHATLWGVPGDPSHDSGREGPGCRGPAQSGPGCSLSGAVSSPLLTLPSGCEGPQLFTAEMSGWEALSLVAEPVSFPFHDSTGAPVGFTGCEHLSFSPSISATPDTSEADTPAGLRVEVQMPQEGLVVNEQLAASDIKGTRVTLPEGVVINPGQAAGLAACQDAQAKLNESKSPPECPAASKVGAVKIKSPLLESAQEKELEGNVYVLQSEPPHLRLLITGSGDGINLKLIARVNLNKKTGQLTTRLGENPANPDQAEAEAEAEEIKEILREDKSLEGHLGLPPLPFTDFKLSFSGGAQAALDTPTRCGEFPIESDFTPTSTPFVSNVVAPSSFKIESGTDGAPCPSSPLPFTLSMIAGSTTDQAGGFTDFSLLLQRPDDQQRIEKLQFKAPEGLAGRISGVPLCSEPQAGKGKCQPASQIGHTVVASGPGSYPLVIPQPGDPEAPIYLTGPYEGAPFGLSIAVPIVAGPFNLGTEVVRSRIEVDPHTTQITVTTDPLPPIIQGVPTDLRTINAVVDRPGFMFNPTNCSPMSFSGIATGAEGASAPLESHFQVGSCQALKFKPDFKVSTSGRTSRKRGASLDAKLIYPTGPLGANQASSQSNIARVKVELPKRLPSRLTTLQKACLAKVFEANPAGCPAASVVGHATAVTPVLPIALTGPAYFVSHGGEKFPSLIVVLQGDNVMVDLEGTTFISKKGITSSTFKSVPDVPVSSFELTLPEGQFSALAANGNLCRAALVMPTEFVAQNGAEIRRNTKISVTGCPKTKKTTAKRKHKQSTRRTRKK